MMGNRRYRIHNKYLAEYVSRYLSSLSAEKKKLLSVDELKLVQGNAVIEDFANNEQLDRVLLLLTKLGKQWDLRIYDEPENEDGENVCDELEFAVINQFQSTEKRVEIIDKMASKGIFYMGATETMLSAMMSGQNVRMPNYKMTSMAQTLPLKFNSYKYKDAVQKSEDTYDEFNNLILQQLNSFDWALDALKLKQDEIRILTTLFIKRNTAVPMKYIAEGTMLGGKMAYLKKSVEKLLADKLIISDKKHGPKLQLQKGMKSKHVIFFMITAEGIRKVMQYNEYIFNKTFGSGSR